MMCNRVESLSGEGVILAVRVVELSYCAWYVGAGRIGGIKSPFELS